MIYIPDVAVMWAREASNPERLLSKILVDYWISDLCLTPCTYMLSISL